MPVTRCKLPLALLGPLVALSLALSGCGKKEEEAAAQAPAPEPTAATETASSDQNESTTDDLSNMPKVDVGATMNAADNALKRNDLVSATDALLKLQLSGAMKDNTEAKVSHYQRMVELQRRVAEAASSGDPNAQRAAALLRQGGGAR